MVSDTKKGLRIPRALMSAAKAPIKFPVRVARGAGAAAGLISPRAVEPTAGEEPVVHLRVQVLSCKDLAAKDKNGKSDPFVVLSLSKSRFQTPVIKRTLNPTFDPKDATFDLPIYLSIADVLGSLEFVVWDKDMLTKDYLGEISIPVEDWFKNGVAAFDDPSNTPVTLNLLSTRSKFAASGSIEIKFGFVRPASTAQSKSLQDIYSDILQRGQAGAPTVMTAPPTRGIGTIRSRKEVPEDSDDSDLEDDGLSSDEDSSDESDDEDTSPGRIESSAPVPGPSTSPSLPTIVAPPVTPPAAPTPKVPSAAGFLPRFFSSRSSHPSPSVSGATTPSSVMAVAGSPPPTDYLSAKPMPPSLPRSSSMQTTEGLSTPGSRRKPKFKRRAKKDDKAYNFSAGKDMLGVVMLEVVKAEDLPKIRNMTRTGWDMDPFVVMSFGKKVFRTRVLRHTLNPQWEEKLLFHVRRYEANFSIHFTVLDWDKFSGNDLVGDVTLPLAELVANAPHPNPETGLYDEGVENTLEMKDFTLPLTTGKSSVWESKHSPRITFRAKYQPYDALRQRFWRQYLKQYDTDETNTISRIELRSMLDSLGSTLTRDTLNSFFTRHGKNPETDDLSVNEVIQCLEKELARPDAEKNRVSKDTEYAAAQASVDVTAFSTPNMTTTDLPPIDGTQDHIEYSGPDASGQDHAHTTGSGLPEVLKTSNQRVLPGQGKAQPNVQPGNYVASGPSVSGSDNGGLLSSEVSSDYEGETSPSLHPSASTAGTDTTPPGASSSNDNDNDNDDRVERVVNIKTCPLCHRPRLNSKAEADIVAHLGVCASSDWARVDRIVVGNYVTASQAQRKWYTKVIGKVSSGAYQLGANSANIIVQNRMTGQLEEEKMQVYVRLGIRLLYKGASSRMEGGRARRLLKSLSIKQGIKFDAPESARDIPAFIAFHKLKVDEIRDPIDSFKTFNEFFYRKLKEDARPVDSPNDPSVLVSGADCRMMAFESVTEATKLWIKGREFTVAKLLGPRYAAEAHKYTSGALAIFRLAPQDYHRFHSPVDGTIGPMTYIAGEYYTVNPQAVRTSLDIYGDNARKIVPIDSPQFGRVYAVCIGAMMVGSIVTTAEEGQHVARGQEFGYFAFGGSTIVLLFEKGVVEWDEDLLLNGRACLETLVRVGMKVGRSTRSAGA